MTVKDFWHLKLGTVVKDNYSDWTGTVIKRQVIDECYGFIISKTHTTDLKTGRKLLEITFDIGNNDFRYINTSRPDHIKDIEILK